MLRLIRSKGQIPAAKIGSGEWFPLISDTTMATVAAPTAFRWEKLLMRYKAALNAFCYKEALSLFSD